MALATAFAAVARSGCVRATGVSAACAERNGVVDDRRGDRERVDDERGRVDEDADRRRADQHDPDQVRRRAAPARGG